MESYKTQRPCLFSLSHFKQLKKVLDTILAILAPFDAQPYIFDDLKTICFKSEFWCNIISIMDMIKPLVETVFTLEGNASV